MSRGVALAPRYLITTAYYSWSARHVDEMALRLGRTGESEHYRTVAHRVRSAFIDAYVRPDGLLTNDTQTAYAIALQFDLLPGPVSRVKAGRRLADLVAAGGHTIQTGFIGTPLVAPALTAAGQIDAAYALLLQQDCPSWLYALKHDATTVWERWDSMLPDGTVNPGGMTSFNHYALGAVARWLHTEVAGLTAAAPGYREVVFQPRPGDGLTWATATHDSPYGRLAIQWELDPSGNLSVRTTVPTGVNARIEWPAFTTAGTAIGCVWRRPSPQLLPRSPRRSRPARVAAHDTVVVIGARVVQEGGPAPKPFAPRPCGTGARSAINRDVR